MVASSTSLPELSRRESSLLAAFIILRFDYVALAEGHKLLPEELLAFALSPAVAAHLAALKSFAEMAFSLRSLESRTTALDTLERVAKSSPDLIEQRRAATTILRGLCPSRAPRATRESAGPESAFIPTPLRTPSIQPLHEHSSSEPPRNGELDHAAHTAGHVQRAREARATPREADAIRSTPLPGQQCNLLAPGLGNPLPQPSMSVETDRKRGIG